MSTERVTIDESVPVSPSGRELNLGNGVQRYPVPTTGRESGLYLSELERRQTMPRQNSMVDYMVPTVRGSEHPSLPKSVEDRLKDTIANADREEKKYARKGKLSMHVSFSGPLISADRAGRAEPVADTHLLL